MKLIGLSAVLTVQLLTAVAWAQDGKDKGKADAPRPGDAKGQAAPKPGWAVSCNNPGTGLTCAAGQTIVAAGTNKMLLRVTVSKAASDPNAGMMIHLPHGLFNPAGVSVRVDEQKPETIQIQTCDGAGCYAGLPVTAERLKALRNGTVLNIQFQDLRKNNITVPVPLLGFADAYAKL